MLTVKIVFTNNPCSFSKYESYLPLLPKERQEKISRLRFEKDKALSLLSGLLICSAAYERSGMKPKEIQLEYNEHGKPSIKALPQLYFSVSHSGSCAAFVSDSFPIGIDIEKISDSKTEIAKRFFSPNEYKYIAESSRPDIAFYEIWTKKEAYLKLIGTGFYASLRSFDVTEDKFKGAFYTRIISDYMLSVLSYERRPAENIPEIKIYDEHGFFDNLPSAAWL